MLAVVLALSASLSWGVADFFGALFSRRISPVIVVLVLEAGGLVAMVVVLAITGEPAPGAGSLASAALAGIAGTLGLVCFFRGMALGAMAVVAPVFAAGASSIPVVYGLATGDTLGTVVAAGLVLVVIGIVLASLEDRERELAHLRAGRAAIAWALAGAAGAAIYIIASDSASDGSVAWTLLAARAAAVPVLALGLVVVGGRPSLPGRRDLAAVAGVGLIDLLATAFFGVATTRGQLAVVAVLGSMYPVVTAGLARVVLHERVRRVQLVGVASALLGVVLVAGG